MKKVLILSGGMDSTTLLYKLVAEGHEVHAVLFDYGQRHKRELAFAAHHAQEKGAFFEVINIAGLGRSLGGSSALVTPELEVPEGHYAAESMKATVVPNRNMIMLSIATGIAIARGAGAVAYAAHPGDHAIYPDCRAEFAEALGKAITLCDWVAIELERPFVVEGIDKAGIAKLGSELGVAFDMTWSCYKGGHVHCGNCGTCVERREAFELAGVTDPTEYSPDARPLAELLAAGGAR